MASPLAKVRFWCPHPELRSTFLMALAMLAMEAALGGPARLVASPIQPDSLPAKPKESPFPIQSSSVDPPLKGVVTGISFSPDGKHFALACEDKCVRIYDWPSGKERTLLQGHKDRVWATAYAPDGKMLAACCGKWGEITDTAEIKLWDLTTARVKATLQGHKGLIIHVAFSPDGKGLISGGADGTARIWDIPSGKERKVIENHKSLVRAVGFTPDGKAFVTAGFDGTLRFWDAAMRKPLRTFEVDPRGVQGFVFTPEGKRLVTATWAGDPGSPGEIKVWDLDSGKELRRFSGLKGTILSLDISPNGATLAVGGGFIVTFGEVVLFELASGQVRANLGGHRMWVEGIRFSPEGRGLVSVGGSQGQAPDRMNPAEVNLWRLPGLRPGEKGPNLAPERLQVLWDQLADRDAAAAYRAVLELTMSGNPVPFLKRKIRTLVSLPPVAPQRLAQLIADLDSDDFNARENAFKELEKLGDLAQPALEKMNAETKSAEVMQRVALLLRRLKNPALAPEFLQSLRALEVLESLASPEARQVLQELAKGDARDKAAEQARWALQRLTHRGQDHP